MPSVGRPRTSTNIGTRVPTTERGVPYSGIGGGISGSVSPLTGVDNPWRMYADEWEFVPELQWPWNIWVFDKMRTDSQLAGLLTATIWGITQLRFVVDPNGARPELVKQISQDFRLPILGEDDQPIGRMKRRFSHHKHVFQAMLALIYGHYHFEQVVQLDDSGFARLRKLAPRPPHTIRDILVADDGGLVSIRQWAPNDLLRSGVTLGREIGVDRLTAFVFGQEGASQTGRSMLRDCYKDWILKDRDLRIESINHERAGGVPYAVAPMGANDDDIASLNLMMQKFRIGETAGAGLPFGTELKIAKGTGSDVDGTIKRLDESMARRFLLQLANLAQGGQNVGSYALSENLEDFFLVGQRVMAQWYCDIMTEHVIEDLTDWNYGEDEELTPLLTWERNTEDSLGVEALAMLVDSKIVTVDEDLENKIRYRYLLPKLKGERPPSDAELKQQQLEQQDKQAADALKAQKDQPAPAPAQPAPAKKPVTASAGSLGRAPSSDGPAPFRPWWPQRREPDVMAKDGPVLVTVPNVPLLEAGVEYQLSTGKATFTPEDLADAVCAANEDPAIQVPRLKLGHIDPRYNNALQYDGTPAFGKATNLRLSDNGMVIYADYVGVPKWLADIMPTAYPNRSVEGYWNITSNTGKTWRFVLSACSLLGVVWPGISQLDDLPMLASYFGEKMPADVIVVQDVAASNQPGGDPKMPALASANLDDVRRAFYQQYVVDRASAGSEYWWVRQVLTDPNELVVEDESDGQLYVLPFSSNDKAEVSFGEPTAVRLEYVADDRKKAAASHIAAALAEGRTVLASWPTRAESRPDETGGTQMDPKQVRERLNLPEDASDEQVQEALRELATGAGVDLTVNNDPLNQTAVNSGGGTAVGTGVPEPGTGGNATAPPEGTEVTASAGQVKLPPGLVVVDEGTLETLKAGAAAGFAAEKRAQVSERDADVAAAIGDGRIPKSRKEHWEQYWENDPAGAKAALASLKPGLIPVDGEHGHAVSQDGAAQPGSITEETVQQWTASIFPEVAAQRQQDAALASGQAVRPRIFADSNYRR